MSDHSETTKDRKDFIDALNELLKRNEVKKEFRSDSVLMLAKFYFGSLALDERGPYITILVVDDKIVGITPSGIEKVLESQSRNLMWLVLQWLRKENIWDKSDSQIQPGVFNGLNLRKVVRSERWHLLESRIFDQLLRLGNALSDETRIRILFELFRTDSSIIETKQRIKGGVAEKTLRYHFDVLENTRLVKRAGKGWGRAMKSRIIYQPTEFATTLIYRFLISDFAANYQRIKYQSGELRDPPPYIA